MKKVVRLGAMKVDNLGFRIPGMIWLGVEGPVKPVMFDGSFIEMVDGALISRSIPVVQHLSWAPSQSCSPNLSSSTMQDKFSCNEPL